MARSLWAFTEGWGEEAREGVRAGLRRVLNAAVAAGGGGDGQTIAAASNPPPAWSPASSSSPPSPPPAPPPPPVHYYQGLHDVASVLLLVTGSEPAAFRLLTRLTVGPLRDCTRPTLAPALATVRLLPALLAAADPALASHLAPIPPHYVLPWHLTWFAHGVPPGPAALAGAARLFDLFSATHPLMPLYVAAAALTTPASRAAILAVDRDDPGEVHGAVGRLPHLGGLSPDAAALRALELYRAHPPAALVAAATAAAGGGGGAAGGRWGGVVLRRRAAGEAAATPSPPLSAPVAGAEEAGSAAAGARLSKGGVWEAGDAVVVPEAASELALPPPPARSVSGVAAGLAVLALTVATAALSARGGGGA